jgi:hypothetical protein
MGGGALEKGRKTRGEAEGGKRREKGRVEVLLDETVST